MLRKTHRRMSNEKAFTLIEVIVSMVLLGILAATAGMVLTKITEGYLFARLNAETVQKAQIAIARIVKELGSAEKASAAATAITTANSNSVTYTRREPVGSNTFITNTIDLSGSTVRVRVDGAATAILIDNVSAFSLLYFDVAGHTLAAPVAVPNRIRRIVITLTINSPNNTPITFDNNNVFMQEF